MSNTTKSEDESLAERGLPSLLLARGAVGRMRSVARLLRPHQWLKNTLVFLPVVAAHEVSNVDALLRSALAFVAFSLTASSLYVLNDYLDVAADRAHPRKRHRPFASGAVPLHWATPLTISLLLAAMLPCIALPRLFLWTLVGYALGNLSYSVFLKTRLLVDVLLLAGLYTIRIVGGGAATGIVISPWLFAFSFFLFLSLAYVKRYVELRSAVALSLHSLRRRGYVAEDLELLRVVGPASGYAAVLVLTLYLQSSSVQALYRTPQMLWLNAVLVIYWITRVWFFAQRDALHDDPLVFAATDMVSRLCMVCAGCIVWAAT